METAQRQVKSRNESFAERQVTKIWQETAVLEAPYTADSCRCHGYDLFELMAKRSFVDILFLLFQGELPDPDQEQLLEKLMIALSNPGPRHAATRAAMLAGVGKTDPAHILPIALSVLGGSHLGAGEMEDAMRFIRKQRKKDPAQTAREILAQMEKPAAGDWHPVPGFGSRFGGIDSLTCQLTDRLAELPGAGPALAWSKAFSTALHPHNMGILATGMAAAVFSDLGFHPRTGGGLLQLLCAPGILAHGLELANKPITAMPFPKDENYIIEEE
ncbi:MAG: citrate/2-methylcitrate synthase [Desulfuromonadaceae bacterium]